MFLFRSIWCATFLLLADVAAAPFFHFEARQTHPIALTPNGARLLALNSPDARLSVFDVSNPANPTPVLVEEIPVGLELVSVQRAVVAEVAHDKKPLHAGQAVCGRLGMERRATAEQEDGKEQG